ncbi:hypothetical protein PMAYCL1PPCAC_12766 [Pristionchus mayeri]|uniref:Uncharacterized protein n=1 Tax=Pristionchus mayeri TaxID=1317129 RepID=A0AAN4ZKR4_9BILA|nr:hypothetical protein PMAYCL1PPCAC_12766 [Pristionchus mayeri]
MDRSTYAIRSELQRNSSDSIVTTIQTIEHIESTERKDKYIEFRRNDVNHMKESFGFMPLVNKTSSDFTFIRRARKFFAKGIRTPGIIYPFFGSNNSGVCISRKPDTVFTAIEEGIDYWILVCAVAYDSKMIEKAKLFSKSSDLARSMVERGNIEISLKGDEPPGWRRHFECIQKIMYVEGGKPCDYPCNVLPLAVAKVQFSRRDSVSSHSLHIVGRPPTRGTVGNVLLRIEELSSMRETVFDKLIMTGTAIYSRYGIEEEEWPDYLSFDDYNVFPSVFKSWIMKGKLNIEELLNQGNVKMETKLFYDHSYKECSRPHPPFVYLNYYEVAPPIEEMANMMKRLTELEEKDMVLFGCCPLTTYFCHILYAAVPPGELANRLGLPTIPGGRFHLIQALPVTRGSWKDVDYDSRVAELFKTHPYAPAAKEDGKSLETEVIELDTDEEEEGNGRERREEPLVLPHLLESPSATAAETAPWDTLHAHGSSMRIPEDVCPSSPLPLLPSPLLPPSSSPGSLHFSFISGDNGIQMGDSEQTRLHCDSSLNHPLSSDSNSSEMMDDISCIYDSEKICEGYDRRIAHGKYVRHYVGEPQENINLYAGEVEIGNDKMEEKVDTDNYPSVVCIEDEEEVAVPSTPPNERPLREESLSRSGFRIPKAQRMRHSRTVNALLEGAESPIIQNTSDQEEFVVWNREKKESSLQSVIRLPPSAMVVVVDNELLRQIRRTSINTLKKNEELTPLIKILNENADNEDDRILIVLHDDFDPDDSKSPKQLRNINPFVLFVMKHSEETKNNVQVECCDRVKGIRGDDNVIMAYLTPNTNSDLPKNVKLVELGFKIYNISELVAYWQSKQFED